MKNSRYIIVAFLITLSSFANAQQAVTNPRFVNTNGPVFRNEQAPRTMYIQPDGSTYISYDWGGSWKLLQKGTGVLPVGVHALTVRYPHNLYFSKFGVDYVSYNGGRTFWNIAATKIASRPASIANSAGYGTPKILSIVPNPSSGLMMVTLGVQTQMNVTVTLCDASGRVLKTAFEGSMGNGSIELPIDASNMPSGTYFVRVESDAGSTSSKFVIER